MDNKTVLTLIVLIGLGVGGFYFYDNDNNTNNRKDIVKNNGFGAGQKAIVYKSPTCGCCVGYAKELERQGFDVEVIPTDDIDAIKDENGIISDKQSCHTIAMGDYFIEGHVPMEAVKKLLNEKPNIEGIGLPRMPSGTPGMSGPKRSPYEVYQLKDGKFSEFITI